MVGGSVAEVNDRQSQKTRLQIFACYSGWCRDGSQRRATIKDIITNGIVGGSETEVNDPQPWETPLLMMMTLYD